MEFFTKFPVMERSELAEFRKGIDFAFRDFSRAYGDGIEAFFDPLLYFLVWLEKLLINSPWPVIIGVICGLAWIASRNWKLVLGAAISFFLIGYFGMWKDCMATVAIITVCVMICMAAGIPVGVLMARSDRVEKAVLPVLDMMQTIPSFVYLIPILMLLGIGKVPGLIAICIYAVPPIIRLTNLGIREVDKETIEASEAFGATKLQKLRTVQIPLALPTVFAGVNQTIMMALAMVVIASMIGVKGLGVPILRAVLNQYLALGLFNGLAIVALAIIFDRAAQEYGKRIQKHRGIKK
jgi:glycine betaine/proline transport system permease protein|tara:strand:- start:432 stop:1316 length:885 start_codon:yes stop_codon:yes gene_type:complete